MQTVMPDQEVKQDESSGRGPARAQLLGTGRHLDALELRAWTRFLDASRLLEERLGRHLQEFHGMTHREYEILVRIDGNDGAMRMSALANQIVASGPLVSQTVDRLVERGWLTRRRPPRDSRGVEAVLTELGGSELLSASGPHAELVRLFLLDSMSRTTMTSVGDALDEASSHMRVHRAGEICQQCAAPRAR